MGQLFTDEQEAFFRIHVIGRKNQDLTDLMNETFGIGLKNSQTKNYKCNNKIRSGYDGKFKKGDIPSNKGKRYPGRICDTSFKKGQPSINKMPLGAERIAGKGDYIIVKVAQPDVWKQKQRVIYEKLHGEVPDGHVIIFADGNKRNFDKDNLIMISKRKLLVMNRNHLIKDDADLTRTGLIIADIEMKANEIKKRESEDA